MTDEERTAQIAMLEIRAAKLRAILRRANIDPREQCSECCEYFDHINYSCTGTNGEPYNDYCPTIHELDRIADRINRLSPIDIQVF